MEMTYNDAVGCYNLISNIKMKNDNDELSKNLKVKIVKNRIAFSKANTEFDTYMNQAAEELKTPRMIELSNIQNRNADEDAELNKMIEDANTVLISCSENKQVETVNVEFDKFTEEEFSEIIRLNVDDDVVINEVKLTPERFLELIHLSMVG